VPYVPTDAIASMPPEARDHEPRSALDGGVDGLQLLARVVAEARDWLIPGGSVFLETSESQVPTALYLLAAAGLRAAVNADEDREGTVLVGTAP
jgi:release factor glutamine methyltransferase